MRMTITFGRDQRDTRNRRNSVERNIEQLNSHLLAEEIKKIRKMLPLRATKHVFVAFLFADENLIHISFFKESNISKIEYRRRSSQFQTQLETLKSVEQVDDASL